MPRSNHAGVTSADPIDESHVVRATGEVEEVNQPEAKPIPTPPKREAESVEEVPSSPGNSSSASPKSSESTKQKSSGSSRTR